MAVTLTYEEMEARWAAMEGSPQDDGSVEMIVRRPAAEQREDLQSASFTAAAGLAGDDWLRRSGDPEAQITLMNSRLIHMLAGDKARWAEAGDQLFVDLDISQDNLPAGTRLRIGGVVMEVSPLPHTGCTKFARRFGGTGAEVDYERCGGGRATPRRVYDGDRGRYGCGGRSDSQAEVGRLRCASRSRRITGTWLPLHTGESQKALPTLW